MAVTIHPGGGHGVGHRGGQIDLSVGALTGFLGALSAMVLWKQGWPLWAAFLLPIVWDS
jgi:ABC-type xylose transport system permease subunit